MPIVDIKMTAGSSDDQKSVLIRRVTDAVMQAIAAPEANITVLIQEVPAGEFGIGGICVECASDEPTVTK